MNELIYIKILIPEKYLQVTGLGMLSNKYAMMPLKTTWKLERFITYTIEMHIIHITDTKMT